MRVFINCPFDEDYKPFLNRILFVLIWADLEPVLLLDYGNKNLPRFERIKEMLKECPVSIHDLSRNKCGCESTRRQSPSVQNGDKTKHKKKGRNETEHYRLNMPLELGYALACVDFSKGKDSQEKRIFIMANHRADVLIAANDINNYDPEYHGDEVHKVTTIIRNFLIQEALGYSEMLPDSHLLEEAFMDFQGGLKDPLMSTIEIKKKIRGFISMAKTNFEKDENEANSRPTKKA